MRALGDAGPLVILACYPCSADLWTWQSLRTFLAPVFQQGANVIAQETRRWEKHRVLLMVISISVAGLGWLLPGALQSPSATARAHRRSLGGLYQAVVHKYYVDEIYAAFSSNR